MATYGSGNNVIVGVGGTQTLTPAAGVTSATLTLIGAITTFDISAGTGIALTINNTVAVGSTLNIFTDGGNVTLENNTFISAGALGAVNANISAGGSFTVGANLITAGVIDTGSITFGTGGGTSIIGTTGSFISLDLLTAFTPYVGFTNTSDIIDAKSSNFSDFTSYTITQVNPTEQEITVNAIVGGVVTSFQFETSGTNFADGTYTNLTGGPLTLSSDGSGGTDITVCFLAGTHIATPDGERAVETLQKGDLVSTADGRVLPVRWLGVQTVSTVFADPLRVVPIRLRAGSLGENLPCRDLLVSPGHAVFVDGVLINAGALVNGMSIVRETNVPKTFNYYHLELQEHCLVLAEGAAAESFIDGVEPMTFGNWSEHEALGIEGLPVDEMDYPRAKSSRQIPASVKALLAERCACLAEPRPAAA